ncbi:transcriptional repressor [Synechococcales cyanobacterium C]|uniref:Transcriptional repressor n=1 Tax=Petrachloros mirabilis ULC683 TaxID=2781853 RepID=A0A8K2A882_9CYAN|nr:Fur family transcriptional regulator [Petrachloros mirabilis]NCJ07729.1 transcriptional repressor [Petrachloros mirabilis ULC683]
MKTPRLQSQDKVLKILKVLDAEISAQDLFVELRKADLPLGLATVYRALEGLKLTGVVQARLLNSGETLYSLSEQDRHHFTCLQCGTSIPLMDGKNCPVHALEAQLRQTAQFEIYYHTLEFFGLCSPCQLQQANSD